MPRFRDEWVIDRVLFDFVSGGSCACCGLQHFLPNGTADLIGAVSDLETDQQQQEVAALQFHPWPPELRDQVWADRVRLRQKLKLDKSRYAALWNTDPERRQRFVDWCGERETVSKLRRWFQLSRTEIMETIQQRYNIHSAFGVVLCTVLEQVAAFSLTDYPPDGRGREERDFEALLTFDRRGGFTFPLLAGDSETAEEPPVLLEENWQVWLRHWQHNVGSPGRQLLVRKDDESSSTSAAADEGDPDGPEQPQAKTSFASDRRILRLLIARHWAELLESKFRQHEAATTTSTISNDGEPP